LTHISRRTLKRILKRNTTNRGQVKDYVARMMSFHAHEVYGSEAAAKSAWQQEFKRKVTDFRRKAQTLRTQADQIEQWIEKYE